MNVRINWGIDMLTVKQAKELGVVFVEGDVVDDGVLIGVLRVTEVNSNYYFDHLPVTSFTDRKHAGDEMPCDGDLPIVIYIHGWVTREGYAKEFNWSIDYISGDAISWKPDLEALEKLANEKEEKPMAEKQYTYELVTDLTTNEIAKAMIDGEVFYSKQGSFTYKWNGKRFIESKGLKIAIAGEFYRRKETETITRTITYPKPISEPLHIGGECWIVTISCVQRVIWINDAFNNNFLSKGLTHLTRENAQAHWDALFGNK